MAPEAPSEGNMEASARVRDLARTGSASWARRRGNRNLAE